jgi:hypothetical protein
MDALDLQSVFAIAAETLDGVRDFCEGCAECAEILVLYANGRKSGVQRIWHGRHELPELALPVSWVVNGSYYGSYYRLRNVSTIERFFRCVSLPRLT